MLANVLGSTSGQAIGPSPQETGPAFLGADTDSAAQVQRTHCNTDDKELDDMLTSVLGGGQAAAQAATPAGTAVDTLSAAQAQQMQPETGSRAMANAAEGASAERSAFHLPDSLLDSSMAGSGVGICLWCVWCHDSEGLVISLPWALLQLICGIMLCA
jgi:hypothetical protein